MAYLRQTKPSHLGLILKIAEVGQLQKAASSMAMSQPAASRILADIEKSVGAPLFKRGPKGMEETLLGAAVVRHARVILSELDGLDKDVQRLKNGLAGEVRIGSVTGPAVAILMPALEAVRAHSPHIDVTIEVGPSTDLVRGLDEGRFDFIFARMPATQDSRDFLIHPAQEEIVRLIIRDSHPLVGRTQVQLQELHAFDWVIQERGSPIRLAVEEAFHSAGEPTPTRVINSSSLLIVVALLERSDVIAPLANEVADLLSGPHLGAHLTTIDLAQKITVSPYFIIRNRFKELPQVAKDFFDEVVSRVRAP
ncbi:LysR family transcriptional regulator [Puniceibacterium confluentis]|uniref:LysR family transcriptional regulator n=1 Tax=Puniceibacterium confluentis TaxID=1958944 RepID=UPI0011B564A5|nr:LysR family transcriptional regulator [Puniceibacterium confluentis]